MKNLKKPWVIGAIALIIGISAGYLFWGSSQSKQDDQTADQQDEKSEDQIWTCSMHPQIRQNDPGDCPICGMELIPLEETGGEQLALNQLEMSEEAVKIADVQTSEVKKEVPVKQLYLQGKVKPDERLIAAQTAHFPGRIEKLYVNFTGQKIRKGQRIASIYSPEMITAQEELFEALKYEETNPTLLKAARNKLKLWKLTNEQIKAIESSGEVRTEINLLSDHSGYVSKLNVAVGDHVMEGHVLMEVIDLSRVWVEFDAYESDIAWIEVGDKIQFTVKSLPGKVFESKITYIDPVLNPQTRVVKVRTEFKNPEELLKPDMFANAILSTGLEQKGEVLLVPKSAVLWTGKRAVVYVKDPTRQVPTFEYREVMLGTDAGNYYVVASGLEEGEEVVTNGVFKVDAAAQLQGKPSMMNPEGGKTSTGHDHGQMKMEDGEDMTEQSQEQSSSPERDQFRKQLSEVYHTYLDLKDALVGSDSETALEQAQQIEQAIRSVDMSLLGEGDHIRWMELQQELTDNLNEIKEGDLERERQYFSGLSDTMYQAVKHFGITNGKVYYQYCPMALDNKGAYWLSNSKEIRNPYFGEKMLKCGSTKEIL